MGIRMTSASQYRSWGKKSGGKKFSAVARGDDQLAMRDHCPVDYCYYVVVVFVNILNRRDVRLRASQSDNKLGGSPSRRQVLAREIRRK